MRYLVYMMLCALSLYAITADEIYFVYKSKGIKAVEELLKKEYENKEQPAETKSSKEVEVFKEQPSKEPVVREPIKIVKKTKPKAPSERELISKDYWLKQLKNVDVSYGFYDDVDSLIVCEKEKKRCEVYRNGDDGLKLVKVHDDVIMGKGGDKTKRGDLKTPVGVYEIIKRFKPTNQFYGPLAFSLSYPNLFDTLRNKSGDGIWIHGKPLDGKDRDDLSKGCVVMDNNVILNLDAEINADSTVVIIGENKVPRVTAPSVAAVLSEVYKWQHAWKVNDLNAYLNFYSNEFKKSDGSGKAKFSAMKQQIFSRKENKTIVFEKISVSPYPTVDDRKLFKISFYQIYKSPSFASKGDKELYVEMVGDKMQILAEK